MYGELYWDNWSKTLEEGKTKPLYGHKSLNSFPLRSPTLNGKETRHI
jgi:hypothetical protein